MLNQIWLHIGAEKTGTTTIQRSLMLSRSALDGAGVLFPESLGKFNHISLTAYSLDDDRGIEELRLLCGLQRNEEIESFRNTLKQRLDDELSRRAYQTAIFSNEHCSSRLTQASEIQRLKDLCFEFADNVKVVLYIRNRTDFLASWYSTAIASGNTMPFPWPAPNFLKRASDWWSIVCLWSEIFGEGNIIVRRMDRLKMLDNNLLTDFYSSIGMPGLSYAEPAPENESLSAKAILFLMEMNKLIPQVKDGKINADRHGLVDILRQMPSQEKFLLTDNEAIEFESAFAATDELLRTKFFPADSSLFSPAKLWKSDRPRPTELTASEIMEITCHLWLALRSKLDRK